MSASVLYRLNELSIRTLYSEVKERTAAAGALLPGSPGTLVKRDGTGHAYWYRSYYPLPKTRAEDYVGAVDDTSSIEAMRRRIEFSTWVGAQVSVLSKVGFQVADKGVAAVLVALHNLGLFEAGLAVTGTLAYMSWLNEYGAMAVGTRTQDIDLARRFRLKLATTVPFLASLQATQLPFTRVPGMPRRSASTSVKLPGAEGLRVDVLSSGPVLGNIVEVPELDWHAQTIPHYDYLLDDTRWAAMLAGGHCVPVKLPDALRMMWHKLYSSVHRLADPTKAEKDLLQAATIGAIVIEQEGRSLRHSFENAPRELRAAALARRSRIKLLLAAHPQALEEFEKLR